MTLKAFASSSNKRLYYVGTKDFGYNLNWLIRLKEEERRKRYNLISADIISADAKMALIIPESHYISLLSPTIRGNMVPITDDLGRILSTDRAHLTKYGAIFFGDKAVKNSEFSTIFD